MSGEALKLGARKLVRHKRIRLSQFDEGEALKISDRLKLTQVFGKILAARGFKADESLSQFLVPSLREGLPHARKLKGLDQACQVLSQYIRDRRGIGIACDFDVDGLSGGSQLYALLQDLQVPVHLFVPDRFKDGYGLNLEIVEEIKKSGCDLLVTIDFGTKNNQELEYAKELGMRSLVIDHHHVDSDHRPVDLFINPQQEGCGFADGILCAAGLVWYVIAGLREYLKGVHEYDPRTFLDLACLGTICDMVPLQGVNRVIATKGLQALSQTPRKGLKKLLELVGAGNEINAYDVSFGVGPRVNAAGRMVHGGIVVELFTTKDSLRASELAHKLHDLNAKRQREERRVLNDAIRVVSEFNSVPEGISLWSESYHTGVIGIVAQRLVESFYRPAAVMGMDQPGILKGSVRGIAGISVIAVLESIADVLLKYGGHAGAAGFSILQERVAEFQERFQNACAEALTREIAYPYIDADVEVSLADLTFPLLKELEKFAPCGVGNRSPVLLTSRLVVEGVRVLKDAHLKVVLHDGKHQMEGLLWKCADHPALYPKAVVDVAYKPQVNTFQGTGKIQLHIQAVRESAM